MKNRLVPARRIVVQSACGRVISSGSYNDGTAHIPELDMVWSLLLKKIHRTPAASPRPEILHSAQSVAAGGDVRDEVSAGTPVRTKSRRPKLAIFFDTENVGVKWIPSILEKLSRDWDIHLRRAYGHNLASAEATLRKHSVVPVEVLQNTKGKNASDLALTVDAAEELFTGASDGFCVVSADGDFTRLMQRIREKGKTAIAFGTSAAPEPLRNACAEFHLLEIPKKDKQATVKKDKVVKAAQAPAKKQGSVTVQVQKVAVPKAKVQQVASPQTIPREMVLRLRQDLRRTLGECIEATGADTLEKFGNYLAQKYPEFSPRRFGFRKLLGMVRYVEAFQLEPVPGDKGEIFTYRLRLPEEAAQPNEKTHGLAIGGEDIHEVSLKT